MKKYSYVIGNPPYITITHKIQKEKINMNNKKIMKVTSTIPLLLTLGTDCLRNAGHSAIDSNRGIYAGDCYTGNRSKY